MSKVKLGVIDYGMGNLHSVKKAFERLGAEVDILVSPPAAAAYEKIVLPGVGSLGDCMKGLQNRDFVGFIHEWIGSGKPFLGVCLGLQALFEYSEENDTQGLGVFPGKVIQFKIPHEFKVPHMGWNAVAFSPDRTAMNAGLSPDQDQFYFDHSYYVSLEDEALVWGSTHHGHRFVSAISSGNCYATQFHPEKSQAKGLQIYKNFLNL